MSWAAGTAVISNDGVYRYRLTRGEMNGPQVHWLMLNPSTADALANDQTIRKCIGFTERLGFRGFTVHNLFAVRARDPLHMKTLDDPVGPENRDYFDRMLDRATFSREMIICAWGTHGSYMQQNETALGWLESHYPKLLLCLGKTACGNPKHPLMLAYATPLTRMDGK